MMKNLYAKIRGEPRPLTPEEEVLAGEFLWENFFLDFHAKRKGITRNLMEANLKRLLHNQGAEVAPNLLSYMKDDDVFHYATEIYAYIQLTANGVQTEYWPKALEQSNPYVLRYDVFTLHNRMLDLMTEHKKAGDPHWEKQRAAVYADALKTLEHIKGLTEKHPAFAHFLSGYTHYTLAIGATGDHMKNHWLEAYKEFLLCEINEGKKPKASFIVNLGGNLYSDMPFDNLAPIKAQVEEHLTHDEIKQITDVVNSMKKPTP